MNLMSVKEVAEHLGVSKESVYRFIRQKGLPFVTVGARKKFVKDDVNKWVRKGGSDEL